MDSSLHCGKCGLCTCLRQFIFRPKTCWDVGMFLFVKMAVKSHPFEELMSNLASWTPSNFGKYPKSPR